MPVAVVTDSTACLPADLAARCTVVPLTVVLGERQGREGIDISAAEVTDALAGRASTVTTSRPAPAEFLETYHGLLASGHSAVVSVHLSARLSGTLAAATIAAQELDGRVRVLDSGSTGMGLGFPVLAALRAAEAGAGGAAVAGAAADAIARTSTLFCLEGLEHLRRGGRIGAAVALLGTALAVKPILRVTAEGIVVSDRVRTAERAVVRLRQLAVDAAGDGPVSIAVHHIGDRQRAIATADALSEMLGNRIRRCYVEEIGAVIGAHTGPGLLGVVVHREHEAT